MEETNGSGSRAVGRGGQLGRSATNAAAKSLLVSSVSKFNVIIGSSLPSTRSLLLCQIHAERRAARRRKGTGSSSNSDVVVQSDDAGLDVDAIADQCQQSAAAATARLAQLVIWCQSA